MQTFLLQAFVFSAILVVTARAIDFLIGKNGNRWLKEHFVFRPWYRLQELSARGLVRAAARAFVAVTNYLFGERLMSARAYAVSTAIAMTITVLNALWLRESTDFILFAELGAVLGAAIIVLLIVNPAVDFMSFAVTRILARIIARSPNVFLAAALWIIDFICALMIALISYYAAGLSVAAFMTHQASLDPWDDALVWAAILSGFFPTILHLAFLLAVIVLTMFEAVRRVICFVLDRLDESDERILTVISSMGALQGTLIGALQKWLAG